MGGSSLLVSTYRSFLRHANYLKKRNESLQIRSQIEGGQEMWGGFKWISPAATGDWEHALRGNKSSSTSASAHTTTDGAYLSGDELKAYVKRKFRDKSSNVEPLSALRILGEQLHMESCSSVCKTKGVEVDVLSKYIGSRRGSTKELVNLFSYRIRISYKPWPGLEADRVQLLGRSWMLKEGQNKPITLVPNCSYGVVGQTPSFSGSKPEVFEYISGCTTQAKESLMFGSFTFMEIGQNDSTGNMNELEAFEVTVAPFSLRVV